MVRTRAEKKAERIQQTATSPVPQVKRAGSFGQPIQQIFLMLVAVGLVVAGAWLIHAQVAAVFLSNLWLNGFIGGVFLLGVVTCFWQVFILMQSVSWIDGFARQGGAADTMTEMRRPPQLLAPLAALLGQRGAKMRISTSAARSILESVAARIDEARDITRYLTNLLIFLGLLGTFFGLATTVPAIVDTIRSLAPVAGEDGLSVFGRLMGGLESQLGGMGTAFSSSLLGLAGSLVIGLLELFAGHGQNRFYRELEEWLSSITSVGFAAGDGEGDGANTAVLAQVEVMQALIAQSEAAREGLEARVAELSQAVGYLGQQMGGQSQLLLRIAEAQEKLVSAATGENSASAVDAESRMRLRSIDVQLLRILEEVAAGRQESTAELRADLAALTTAVRQLARTGLGQ